VEEAVELLAYPCRIDNVEVTCRLGADVPIWADPHQLQQLLANLLTNAHHATRGAPQPRRVVLTTRHEAATGRVVLTVADSGPGVPAGLQARIFEPFFTTKSPGQGTGLGLSLCRGIVEGHGGVLRLETTPGGGATFVAELPVGAPPAALQNAPAIEPLRPSASKTILVVDDEPDVATLLAEALSIDGHQVDTVSNGIDALERLRERRYDLIFSDMKMPGMSGAELYRKVAQTLPGVERRMIVVTGDTMNVTTRQFLEETGAASLGKPFGVAEIRRLVLTHLAAIGEHAAYAQVAVRS
jgi:CheY-like chemotaxis protein